MCISLSSEYISSRVAVVDLVTDINQRVFECTRLLLAFENLQASMNKVMRQQRGMQNALKDIRIGEQPIPKYCVILPQKDDEHKGMLSKLRDKVSLKTWMYQETTTYFTKQPKR